MGLVCHLRGLLYTSIPFPGPSHFIDSFPDGGKKFGAQFCRFQVARRKIWLFFCICRPRSSHLFSVPHPPSYLFVNFLPSSLSTSYLLIFSSSLFHHSGKYTFFCLTLGQVNEVVDVGTALKSPEWASLEHGDPCG